VRIINDGAYDWLKHEIIKFDPPHKEAEEHLASLRSAASVRKGGASRPALKCKAPSQEDERSSKKGKGLVNKSPGQIGEANGQGREASGGSRIMPSRQAKLAHSYLF
jgi:hypothetical protein